MAQKIRCKTCASGGVCDRPHGRNRYRRCGCRCDTCSGDTRAAGRAYYAANREAILKKNREYHVRHAGQQRDYAARNRERLRAYQREYRRANRDRILEQDREWRRRNPEKYQAQLVRARERRLAARGDVVVVPPVDSDDQVALDARAAAVAEVAAQRRRVQHERRRAAEAAVAADARAAVSSRMLAAYDKHRAMYREDESA